MPGAHGAVIPAGLHGRFRSAVRGFAGGEAWWIRVTEDVR
jgi:hypothetical protein